MGAKNKEVTVSFRATPEMKEELEKLAEQESRTLSNYLILVLKKHILEQEERGKS